MSPIDSITDDELQALRDRVAELEGDAIRHGDSSACGDALDCLWRDIILARKPDYGDWEYPGFAYRHIKAEFDDLLSRVTTLEQERDAAVADNAAMVEALEGFESCDTSDGEYLPACGACGQRHGRHAPDCELKVVLAAPHPGASLLSRLAAAERVVEKLPVTADEVRVVPVLDTVYAPDGTPMMIVENGSDGWEFESLHDDPTGGLDVWYAMQPDESDPRTGYVAEPRYERVCNCYSTEAAALAAQGGAAQ